MPSFPPLTEDSQVAGNFVANLLLSSTLPDGNLTATLFAASGPQVCPDPSARPFAQAVGDLRHFENTGHGRDFPVPTPTRTALRSMPFATTLKAGERIVLVVSGDSTELFPDPRKPLMTVHAGALGSTLEVPGVHGAIDFVK